MRSYQGTCMVEGAAIGNIFVYQAPKWEDANTQIADVQKEWQRYLKAFDKAREALKKRHHQALAINDQNQADIFEAQEMMLEDEDFKEQIKEIIEEENRSAVYAVMEVSERFAQIFLQMDSDIMKSKAADMRDIASLVIRFLQDKKDIFEQMPEACIVLADRLLPGELAEMDAEKVMGLVLKEGAANSHLGILAAGRQLPMIVCPDLDILPHWNGLPAAIEGKHFHLEPEEKILSEICEKYAFGEFRSTVNLPQTGSEALVTAEGFLLNANIGHPKELSPEVVAACDGVGVFRSEFQYIGKNTEPNEEELFADYLQSIELLEGKHLVIRTIDIGADKKADYLQLPHEENPALGCRGIRLCLNNKTLFITQLRAILRASAYGKVSILLPMICSVEELRESKRIIEDCKEMLKAEGLVFDAQVPVGVMIETPAAVLIAEELALEADFFSVGSNDLTQYCLAVDRENPDMASLYDCQHPAVLKLLKMTAEAANKQHIGLCICGELARETSMTQRLVDLGYRQFSVSPAFIPSMKKQLSLCKR